MAKAMFEKGDPVKIIDTSLTSYGVAIGTRGIVDEDDSINPWVIWESGNGNKRWAANVRHLELVADNQTKRCQPGELKVGDRVTIMGQPPKRVECAFLNQDKIGKQGVVAEFDDRGDTTDHVYVTVDGEDSHLSCMPCQSLALVEAAVECRKNSSNPNLTQYEVEYSPEFFELVYETSKLGKVIYQTKDAAKAEYAKLFKK